MPCTYLTMKYESKDRDGDKPKKQKEIECYPNPHFLYKRNPQNDRLCHSKDWKPFGWYLRKLDSFEQTDNIKVRLIYNYLCNCAVIDVCTY